MNISEKISLAGVIINAVLAVLTLIYVILTNGMLKGVRTQMQGVLQVDVMHRMGTLYLLVKNIGQSDVNGVKLFINTTLELFDTKHSVVMVNQPFELSSLSPSKEIKYFMANVNFQKPENQNKLIQVVAEYSSNKAKVNKQFEFRVEEISKDESEFAGIARSIDRLSDKFESRPRGFMQILNQQKACPICFESIHKNAKKCKHCLSDLPTE